MSTSQKLIFEKLKEKFKESGFEVSKKEGSLFIIKSKSGKTYQIDERILDLTDPRKDYNKNHTIKENSRNVMA